MIDIRFSSGKDEWDAYVSQNNQGIFSHLHGWGEALALIYDLQIFRLVARDLEKHDEIVGILPLIFFPAPGLDPRLVSLPYSDAAGILSDNAGIQEKLLLAALNLAKDLGADHLELRQPEGIAIPKLNSSLTHTPNRFKVGLSRSLPNIEEELWYDIGAKVRNQVRKAKKNGGEIIVGGPELLSEFYGVFSENMRDLGSPVHHRMLFEQMARNLKDQMQVLVVTMDDIPAAAAIVFLHNTTIFNPWASSLRRYRPKCPNMLLYWGMLSHGIAKKCRRFDFGRSSPQASTCRFKCQWGAEPQPLTWHVFSRTTSPWKPECETLVNADWKRLTVETSQVLGPPIRRWISL
jgi:FemAB-related protein (PEP-CTERM system-associated)